MRDQTIFFPWAFPGMNEIIAELNKRGRGNSRAPYNRMKRHWTDAVHMKILSCRLHAYRSGRVFFTFKWFEPNRRRDPDNVAAGGRKFILDGLVQAAIIQNDGWKHVAGWKDIFEVDKKNPGVRVDIARADAVDSD